MSRRKAIRALYWQARFELGNCCPSCGQQKEHFCGMGACFDVCQACE